MSDGQIKLQLHVRKTFWLVLYLVAVPAVWLGLVSTEQAVRYLVRRHLKFSEAKRCIE